MYVQWVSHYDEVVSGSEKIPLPRTISFIMLRNLFLKFCHRGLGIAQCVYESNSDYF